MMECRRSVAASGPVLREDWFYWRLLATGLSFVLFGVGQLTLGILVLPLVRLLPGGRAAREARTRALLRGAFRLFIWFMRSAGVLSYEFCGAERLGRPGQLIVANHPSLIDVAFLLAFVPGANCVVKDALFRNPFTRFAVRGAGYLRNFPAERMIEGAAAALHGNQSVIMFPEGTRTRTGKPLQFHRGAASIAIRAVAVVSPVFIRVQPSALTKAAPWYRIPPRRPHFSLRAGDDIGIGPLRGADCPPAASREFNDRLLAAFTGEIGPERTR